MVRTATSSSRRPRRTARRRPSPVPIILTTAALAALALAVGCSGASGDGGAVSDGSDAPLVDAARDVRLVTDVPLPTDVPGSWDGKPTDARRDAPEAWVDPAIGDPCVDNGDCEGGFCVPSAQGPVCTRTCVEECPDGWACRPVGTSPDVIYLCVDLTLVLCLPCVNSGDCSEPRAGLDGYCLPSGPDGAFCGTACMDDNDCAPGYACETAGTTEGEDRSVCVRREGTCACTPYATQRAAETACYAENELGRCDGMRRCTGAGLSDCDALVPAAETCDHVDNDCDGLTDEEVADPDAIGDPCDDDDDDDGVPDEDDCAPDDPEVGVCDDGNPCTENRCNPAFGVCSYPPRAGDCDDGDACTTGDHCEGGACVFTTYIDVDDGDPCTDDGCDPATGPWHAPLDEVGCDDGDPCTVGERCYAGLCAGGEPLDCDDGNPCTDDTCRSDVEGGCYHTNNRAACDDGDPCTVDDRCEEGACAGGAPPDCDDGEPCTADTCDPDTGDCVHTGLEDGADCDDGDPCNGVSQCVAEVCTETAPPIVCDDDDPCNGVAHCEGGVCFEDAPPVVCEQDDDPCTEARCAPETGACVVRFVNGCCAVAADCDDADPCTDDTCVDNVCNGVPNGLSCHPIAIDVVLPDGAPPLSDAAYVLSPWGRHPVDADGRALVNALTDTAFPVVLVDGGPMFLAAVVPPDVSSVVMDAPATATALLFLYANGLALPPQRVGGYATFLAGHDADGALAAAVAAAVVAGESPFDPVTPALLTDLQAALRAALDGLLGWVESRPLGAASWAPDEGPPEADPRHADGFGVLAARVGPDGVRLTLQSRTPRPAAVVVRRQVEAGEERVGESTLAGAACCTFGTPFAATFGDATTERAAELGTYILDPGTQSFVVDVLAPGTPRGPIAPEDGATWVALTRDWVAGFAAAPVAGWLESLRVDAAQAGCWSTVVGDWLAGRAASWTPTSVEILDLADVTAALLVDVAHERGVFGPCAATPALTDWLDALHGVAGLARRTPAAPPAASFGWMAGERARPAHTSFAVADCLPDCSGAECGSDLCGGSCGDCDGVLNCVDRTCQCAGTCGDLECGPSPCGEDCGTCGEGRHCDAGVCLCDAPVAVGCADDALYWLDGCGEPVGDPVETCLLGCADGRTACNECDPFSACCQSDGSFVPPNVQSVGCDGTCRACDGAGSCGPATDGTDCAGGVCVGGVCKSCLPSDPCCDDNGDFVGAGQNDDGCGGPCEQCNGGGSCIPRPDRIDCPGGVCWQGVCEQCEPGTLCCDDNGDFVAFGLQGPECTGICRACQGDGTCGRAPDGADCPTGVCNQGSCRECLAGSVCCDSQGWFVDYGDAHIECAGTCVQCDGFGSCVDKAWHTSCGAGYWCEDGDCVSICQDECSLGQRRCSGDSAQTCGDYDTDDCVEWGGDQYCQCGCSGGSCSSPVCSSGQTRCSGSDREVCAPDGCSWTWQDCACGCSNGSCQGTICSPGASRCSGSDREVCASDGCSWNFQDCACGCSNGSCQGTICSPGARRCSGNTVQQCNSSGCAWNNVETCACDCNNGSCSATTGTVTLDDNSASRTGSPYWYSAYDHTDWSADGWFNTGAYGQDMVYTFGGGSGSYTATWTTPGNLCGRYKVQFYRVNPDPFDPTTVSGDWVDNWYDCGSIPYRVQHDGGTATVNRSHSGGSGWVDLGTWNFTNRRGVVSLNDATGSSTCTIPVDGMRWVPQ